MPVGTWEMYLQPGDKLTLHGHKYKSGVQSKVEKIAGTNDDAHCRGNDPAETQKLRGLSLYEMTPSVALHQEE